MADLGEAILKSAVETDVITWIGTITAVVYVFLVLKENVWCWSFGIVSSALYVTIYFHEKLWYESLLSIFYVILGVYGWIQWAKEKNSSNADQSRPEVMIGKISSNALFISVSIAVAAGIVMGYISNSIRENSFAYSDAMLTSFSVAATWMTAKKYIENWIFWIAIDAASAVVYIIKGPTLYLTALLFIFYTFMAVAGYFTWRKSLKA